MFTLRNTFTTFYSLETFVSNTLYYNLGGLIEDAVLKAMQKSCLKFSCLNIMNLNMKHEFYHLL